MLWLPFMDQSLDGTERGGCKLRQVGVLGQAVPAEALSGAISKQHLWQLEECVFVLREYLDGSPQYLLHTAHETLFGLTMSTTSVISITTTFFSAHFAIAALSVQPVTVSTCTVAGFALVSHRSVSSA